VPSSAQAAVDQASYRHAAKKKITFAHIPDGALRVLLEAAASYRQMAVRGPSRGITCARRVSRFNGSSPPLLPPLPPCAAAVHANAAAGRCLSTAGAPPRTVRWSHMMLALTVLVWALCGRLF